MTQDDDVYRKVGRGGAGNFFNKSTADAQAEVRPRPRSYKPAHCASVAAGSRSAHDQQRRIGAR